MEQIILNHLKIHGSITSWEAISLYHCTRLGHYILMLRKAKYNIVNERIHFTHSVTNRKSSCVRYILVEGK